MSNNRGQHISLIDTDTIIKIKLPGKLFKLKSQETKLYGHYGRKKINMHVEVNKNLKGIKRIANTTCSLPTRTVLSV